METKTLPESASNPSVTIGKEKEEKQPEQPTTKKRKLESLCSICGVSYSTPSQPEPHSQGQSDEGPYICNSCKKHTNSDPGKLHPKIQSPKSSDRQNICRICGLEFPSSAILGNHLRHHNINHIHLCQQCGEGFQESEKLEKHEQLHKKKADVQEGGESTDGVPGTSAKTSDSKGPWMGCARFCLTEIPSISNPILQGPDAENEENSEDNANITASTTPDINNSDSNPSSEDSDFPQFSVSAGYSLVGTTSDSQEESEAVTSSSNPSVFMIDPPPNNTVNETAAKTMSTSTSLLTTTNPSTVIKHEPVITNVTTSAPTRCAISLLALNRTNVMPSGVCTGRVVSSTTPTTLASKAVVLTVPKDIPAANNTTPLSLAHKTFFLAMPNGMTMTTTASSPSFGNPTLAPKAVYVTVPKDVTITSAPSPGHSSLATTPTQTSKPVFLSVPKEVTRTTTTGPSSSTGTAPFMMNGKRVGQCEYCGMWFEDYAMCLLHKSLHSADDSNPFTCQKCMKKLGNRLEFMAHLVWHLDPDVP